MKSADGSKRHDLRECGCGAPAFGLSRFNTAPHEAEQTKPDRQSHEIHKTKFKGVNHARIDE